MLPIRDSQPANIVPVWVMLIIAVNALVFYLEITSPNAIRFITDYGLIPALIDPYQPITLLNFVTSQFLHGGFIHIISNMLFLWVFGDNVEEHFGIFFPLFYLLSGIVGGVSQYILAPDLGIPMIGASGAIAGILGAYLVLFPRHDITTIIPFFLFFAPVRIPSTIMIVYWFAIQLMSGVASITAGGVGLGGIAYFAHIGGFITGILFGLITRPKLHKSGS